MARSTRGAEAPTPATIAIERLAKMAAGGATAPRMVSAAEAILAGWGAEELEPADLRDRVEALQNDVDAALMAAEDYVAEADTEKGRAAAESQFEALTAVRARLAAIIEGAR